MSDITTYEERKLRC